ncbi:MAG: hypothetical protein KTR25_04300 [Myxococcales bacterium]|nr:hypothetical protein [Myxococcales bacterium]
MRHSDKTVLSIDNKYLSEANLDTFIDILGRTITNTLRFRIETDCVRSAEVGALVSDKNTTQSLSEDGMSLEELIQLYERSILPACINFGSPKFMGFPDTGTQLGGILGAILADLLQQNLINGQICSPSATQVELTVLQWFRSLVGYEVFPLASVWDVGAIVTHGGTLSNTIAMMLARENHFPGSMQLGLRKMKPAYLVVPRGIGHYSVKSAQMWLGCGSHLLEVPTQNYRYDLDSLKETILAHAQDVMAVVAYAGDSRTMTIDNLCGVRDVVRSIRNNIWLHADACHGHLLGASKKHESMIDGISSFDSISIDPHKSIDIPYTASALLVRDPSTLKKISTYSDLIMQQDFSIGQMTPMIGSKSWMSLKIWFAMQNLGRKGMGELVETRIDNARLFADLIRDHPDFSLLNKPDYHSVIFVYRPEKIKCDQRLVNEVNSAIYREMVKEGQWYLHSFTLPADDLRQGLVRPLRYMSGNIRVNETKLIEILDYIDQLGARCLGDLVL